MTFSIEEAKEFVIKAGLELVEAGLVARTWGNISARISDHQFAITPSGRAYDTLTPDDIVVVNIADGTYEGNVKPSGEKGVHAAVYALRPWVNFVIHTHQSYASALSILGEPVAVNEDDDRLILSDVVPCAEYGMYATRKLVNNITLQMQENERAKAVLMKYHGALCMGKDYETAFSVAYLLEKVCKKKYEDCFGAMVEQELPQPYEIDDALESVLYSQERVKSSIFVQTPFIMELSRLGKKQRPYLDDLAQIAGTKIACIKPDANTSQLLKALQKRNAVLIEGVGALCTGPDESEAQAVGIVLEKAAMAALLAHKVGNIHPLPAYAAWKDRKGYVSHYSKLK